MVGRIYCVRCLHFLSIFHPTPPPPPSRRSPRPPLRPCIITWGLAVSVNSTYVSRFPRYSALKKHIYALEKQYAGVDGRIDDLEAATNERSTLLGGDVRGGLGLGGGAAADGGGGGCPADDMFSSLLDRELEKIVRFYREQEAEVLRELYQLEADIAQIDADGPSMRSPYDEFDEDEEDEDNLSPNAG